MYLEVMSRLSEEGPISLQSYLFFEAPARGRLAAGLRAAGEASSPLASLPAALLPAAAAARPRFAPVALGRFGAASAPVTSIAVAVALE